jgi:hypothetical protein
VDFSQYFVSHSADSASFGLEALETIGAPKTAEICKRAIAAAFPSGLPQTPETMKSEAVDQEFSAYPRSLTHLLFDFTSRHPYEFGTLPNPDDA